MIFVISLIGKTFPTLSACVRLVASVNVHVCLQIVGLCETLQTNVTGKRLFPGVHKPVSFQIG